MNMRRAGLLVSMLLILGAALQAQRAGGGLGGRGAQISVGRMPGGHGIGTDGLNGFFPRHSGFGLRSHRGFGSFWLPWYYPGWDDDYLWSLPSYQQPVNTTPPQVIVVENKDPQPPARPVEPPKVIEVAPSKEASSTIRQPPALFLLKNGERLESRYYLLTAHSLQINVGYERRTILVSSLDLDATVAANHQRGIELAIPQDPTTVFLGF